MVLCQTKIVKFGFHAVVNIYFTNVVLLLITGNLINIPVYLCQNSNLLSIEVGIASDASIPRAKEGPKQRVIIIQKQNDHHLIQ